MAVSPQDLKDLKSDILCCLPKTIDYTQQFEAICGKLESLLEVIAGKEDFELKTFSGPKYCCPDGSVYFTIICQKFIDGVKDSEEVIVVGPNAEILTELPECASPCDSLNKYIFEKEVCFSDCTKGCVVLEINLSEPTTPPKRLFVLDNVGEVTEKEIVPCGEVLVIEDYKCLTSK